MGKVFIQSSWPTPLAVEHKSFRVRLGDHALDFGVVYDGDIIPFSVTLVNDTTSTVDIASIDKTCGCTEIPLPTRVWLEPGTSVTLEAQLVTIGKRGEFEETVWCYDSEGRLVATLRPRGYCERKLVAQPEEITLTAGNTSSKHGLSFPCKLVSSSIPLSNLSAVVMPPYHKLIECEIPSSLKAQAVARAVIRVRAMPLNLSDSVAIQIQEGTVPLARINVRFSEDLLPNVAIRPKEICLSPHGSTVLSIGPHPAQQGDLEGFRCLPAESWFACEPRRQPDGSYLVLLGLTPHSTVFRPETPSLLLLHLKGKDYAIPVHFCDNHWSDKETRKRGGL